MSGLRLLALLWALTSAPLAAALDHQHSAFSTLLQAHVQWSADGSASTVDYAGLRRDRAALERYLTELSAVTAADFDRWSEAERLAFLINAYNAYTLALIADADPEPPEFDTFPASFVRRDASLARPFNDLAAPTGHFMELACSGTRSDLSP